MAEFTDMKPNYNYFSNFYPMCGLSLIERFLDLCMKRKLVWFIVKGRKTNLKNVT